MDWPVRIMGRTTSLLGTLSGMASQLTSEVIGQVRRPIDVSRASTDPSDNGSIDTLTFIRGRSSDCFIHNKRENKIKNLD